MNEGRGKKVVYLLQINQKNINGMKKMGCDDIFSIAMAPHTLVWRGEQLLV